jgi:hypothetical protein
MDDESVDLLHGRRRGHSPERWGALAEAAPISALALAVVSLIGLNPAQLLAQSVLYHGHDVRALAVAPGVGALISLISIWLGRASIRSHDAMTWHRPVAAGALVVAVVALVVNAAAIIGALSTPGAGSFVGG